MERTLEIEGRPLRVSLSKAAVQALEARAEPLLAEMELYFSCLIRKRVRFREASAERGGTAVTDRLRVSFRPVMTAHCGTDYAGEEPPLTDFPIQNARAFVPRWLHLDYRHGAWTGEFGFEGPA